MAPRTRRRGFSAQSQQSTAVMRLLMEQPEDVHRAILDTLASSGAGTALARMEGCCKALAALVTSAHWDMAARETFGELGAGQGKQAWILGVSWLRGRYRYDALKKPRAITEDNFGCVTTAANSRYLVAASDDPGAPLCVRKADDVLWASSVPEGNAHSVALFGEDFVALGRGRPSFDVLSVKGLPLEYKRHTHRSELVEPPPLTARWTVDLPEGEKLPWGSVELLGSDEWLVVGTPFRTFVYRVQPVLSGYGAAPPVVLHRSLARRDLETPTLLEAPTFSHVLNWVPALGSDAFAEPAVAFTQARLPVLNVWRAGTGSDEIPHLQCHALAQDQHRLRQIICLRYNNIVGTDQHVIAAVDREGGDLLIHVFGRGGELRWCLIEPNQACIDVGPKVWGNATYLAAQGTILCATSVRGAAVCVWCLNSGTLLRTLDSAFHEPNRQDDLARVDGANEATTLQMLGGGDTLVMGVYGGETYAWHFGGSHGAYEVCDSYDDMMETGTGSDYGWSSSEGEGESEESL